MADSYSHSKRKKKQSKRTEVGDDVDSISHEDDFGDEDPFASTPGYKDPFASISGYKDPFTLIAGGEEGGFMELEEVDMEEYGLIGGLVPDPEPPRETSKEKKKKRGEDVDSTKEKKKKKKKKVSEDESAEKERLRGDEDLESKDSGVVEVEEKKEEKDAKEDEKLKKKRMRRKMRREWQKKKKEKIKKLGGNEGYNNKEKSERKNEGTTEVDSDEGEGCPELIPLTEKDDAEDDIHEDVLLNDDEVNAWKEMRLHPLLLKSIRSLGFREPTPIQKACIPAAAHQGKDVIGAAETGSGKTLAFGLPILQRLLEEREKASRSLQKEENSVEGERGGPLRALVITPTRELAMQVANHLKIAAKNIDIRIATIVGGIYSEKQERQLNKRPEIVVGTPGRLWQLMLEGNRHLVELHSLSFFVLDEADRMLEHRHFEELQSIIDLLPTADSSSQSQNSETCETTPNLQRKKRQTFIFSATIALSDNFRKKLKRSSSTPKSSLVDGPKDIERLSERAGIRADVAIVDLTNSSIMTNNLEESFIECKEEDKDAYLYYILSVHGQGRTIVFCTSILALRRISSLLNILSMNVYTFHGQMPQRTRLKAIDRFRTNENSILLAADVGARGLDIVGVRTVVHYQLPHSAEVYVHRCGRTARASADGCSIALISSGDKTKFVSLCKSMSKETLRQFPVDSSYMPEVKKRLSLARQIDGILHKEEQENANKKWHKRNAESVEITIEDSGSEDEAAEGRELKKIISKQKENLKQELRDLIRRPLQPKTLSHRYLAGAGITPLVQKQLEQLAMRKTLDNNAASKQKRAGLVVIGQESIEPLQALRTSGHEVCVNADKTREARRATENLKRKRRDEKKQTREQLRKQKKRAKGGD